jgi:hypothetical protein
MSEARQVSPSTSSPDRFIRAAFLAGESAMCADRSRGFFPRKGWLNP